MLVRLVFPLFLLLCMGCDSLVSEKPVPSAAVPNTFNYSFSSPYEEFSINFYDQEGKLRVSIPIEQIKYVEWKEWMEYSLHDKSRRQLDRVYLTGGRAEIVIDHVIVNRFNIISSLSSEWFFYETVITTDYQGYLPTDPLIMPFFQPTKEKLHRYLKSKNKFKE